MSKQKITCMVKSKLGEELVSRGLRSGDFEQTPEDTERGNTGLPEGQKCWAKGTVSTKALGAGTDMACSRNSQEVTVIGETCRMEEVRCCVGCVLTHLISQQR